MMCFIDYNSKYIYVINMEMLTLLVYDKKGKKNIRNTNRMDGSY